MTALRLCLTLSAIAILAGCATAVKIESGERMVGDRLRLQLEGAWNRIDAPGIVGPHCETWTMEGIPVDQLLIYSGLKPDEPVHPEAIGSRADGKSFRFRADMQPEQIVALFEGAFTRNGSTFGLTRLAPAAFGGGVGRGFRFEYTLTRKSDNVRLTGIGQAVVSQGELFAVIYQAPRQVFFPRHQKQVEQIMASARVRASAP